MKRFSVFLALVGFAVVLSGLVLPASAAESPQHPLAREFPIEIDGTGIHPVVEFHVPGATESIQSVRPLMSDKKVILHLRPGRYTFGTFTFTFEFVVKPDGMLDYMRSLDQCVSGRGTATLVVHCRRTQPF